MQNDDFCMVLPSNAKPKTQPNNHTADFIVDSENPLELDPSYRWTCAMTEISYIYKPTTLYGSYDILCLKQFPIEHDSTLSINFHPDSMSFTYKLSNVRQLTNKNRYFVKDSDITKPDLDINMKLVESNGKNVFWMSAKQPFRLKMSNVVLDFLGLKTTNSDLIICQYDQNKNLWYVSGEHDIISNLNKLVSDQKSTAGENNIGPISYCMYVYVP